MTTCDGIAARYKLLFGSTGTAETKILLGDTESCQWVDTYLTAHIETPESQCLVANPPPTCFETGALRPDRPSQHRGLWREWSTAWLLPRLQKILGQATNQRSEADRTFLARVYETDWSTMELAARSRLFAGLAQFLTTATLSDESQWQVAQCVAKIGADLPTATLPSGDLDRYLRDRRGQYWGPGLLVLSALPPGSLDGAALTTVAAAIERVQEDETALLAAQILSTQLPSVAVEEQDAVLEYLRNLPAELSPKRRGAAIALRLRFGDTAVLTQTMAYLRRFGAGDLSLEKTGAAFRALIDTDWSAVSVATRRDYHRQFSAVAFDDTMNPQARAVAAQLAAAVGAGLSRFLPDDPRAVQLLTHADPYVQFTGLVLLEVTLTTEHRRYPHRIVTPDGERVTIQAIDPVRITKYHRQAVAAVQDYLRTKAPTGEVLARALFVLAQATHVMDLEDQRNVVQFMLGRLPASGTIEKAAIVYALIPLEHGGLWSPELATTVLSLSADDADEPATVQALEETIQNFLGARLAQAARGDSSVGKRFADILAAIDPAQPQRVQRIAQFVGSMLTTAPMRPAIRIALLTAAYDFLRSAKAGAWPTTFRDELRGLANISSIRVLLDASIESTELTTLIEKMDISREFGGVSELLNLVATALLSRSASAAKGNRAVAYTMPASVGPEALRLLMHKLLTVVTTRRTLAIRDPALLERITAKAAAIAEQLHLPSADHYPVYDAELDIFITMAELKDLIADSHHHGFEKVITQAIPESTLTAVVDGLEPLVAGLNRDLKPVVQILREFLRQLLIPSATGDLYARQIHLTPALRERIQRLRADLGATTTSRSE